MIRSIRGVIFLAAVWALAGCGFQLRGAYTLPYKSLYVAAGDTVVGAGLKRLIRASGGNLVEDPKKAEARFLPAGEKREALIVSLSGSGRVRERRLVYRYAYRVV
ncbi:MAG: hypothetical protein LBS70_08760, partial [Candidatus Accumulibacter sp.]|nr:hypothetical protein [Accumulibacter sp.]